MVDGSVIGDVGSIVLRDRRHLSQDGLIVVVAAVDTTEHTIVSGPDIVSRCFVYVDVYKRQLIDIFACHEPKLCKISKIIFIYNKTTY